MMKHLQGFVLIIALGLSWLGHAFADTQHSVIDSLRQQSVKYAIFQAVQEVVNTAEHMTILNIVDRSAKQISSDVKIHHKISASKQIIESYVKMSFDASLDQKFEVVFQRLKSQTRALDLQESTLKKEVKAVYREVIDKQKSAYMSAHFDRIFQVSRQRAVEEQLSSLLTSAYPKQEMVTDLDRANWTEASLAQLKQHVMGEIRGRTPHLFEENQIIVKDRATAILSKIRVQLDQQRSVLAADIPLHLITKNQIAITLLDKLDQEIKKMQYDAQLGEKIYAPFPSVLTSIDQQAQQTETEQFLQAVANTSFAFNEELMRTLISENLADNKTRDQSAQFLGQRVYSHQLIHVVNHYASRSPAVEANEFKQRLQIIIKSDRTIQERIKIEIINALKKSPEFKKIRNLIAQLQVKNHFVPIHEGSWVVPESSLEKMSHTPKHKRYGGVESIEKALTLPHLNKRSMPYHRNTLLEETEDDLLTRIQKLLEEGKRAWDRQFDIVRAHEDFIKKEWPKHRHTLADSVAGSEDYWITQYTQAVEEKWRAERVQLLWRGVSTPPPYMATKYSPLFPYMEKEIRRIVLSYLNSHKQTFAPPGEGDKAPSPDTVKPVTQSPAPSSSPEKQNTVVSNATTPTPTLPSPSAKPGPGSGPNPQDGDTGGGNQSVKSKEASNRGDEPIPSEGGRLKELSWWPWLLFLLVLLIVALVILIVVFYRRYRTAVGTIEIRVKNLDETVDMFTPIIGQTPIRSTDGMTIYQTANGSQLIFVQE